MTVYSSKQDLLSAGVLKKPKRNYRRAADMKPRVLELIAHLGSARSRDLVSLYLPPDIAWHQAVSRLTAALLAWAARHQCPVVELPTELSRIAGGVPGGLEPVAKRAFKHLSWKLKTSTAVDFERGTPCEKSQWKSRGVPSKAWLKARSLACHWLTKGAQDRLRPLLNRLVEDRLLGVEEGAYQQRTYRVTTKGLKTLSEGFALTEVRTGAHSAHQTLAQGYLVAAISRGADGWSERALKSRTQWPGMLGGRWEMGPGELVRQVCEVHDGSYHPPDGLIIWPQNELGVAELELIEAERGAKNRDKFVRSLVPLREGQRAEAGIYLNKETRWQVKKVTFVINDWSFVADILEAAVLFVEGNPSSSDARVDRQGRALPKFFGLSGAQKKGASSTKRGTAAHG